jgi:glycosyltransferase involved in cell wall biosynthesis
LKVAIISHSYPTKENPAQATFIKEEAHLISKINEVYLLLPTVYATPLQNQYYRTLNPLENDIDVSRFNYLSFPRKSLPSITRWSLSRNLLKTLNRFKIDLVHLHWLFPSGLAVPSLKKAGKRTVLTIHGGDWYKNESNKTLKPFLDDTIDNADKIICVGSKLLNDVALKYPEHESKLTHVPHGIDTSLFCSTGADKKATAKKTLGWSSDKTHLLCVANLYREKGVDLLLKAFSDLPDISDLHLHLISPQSNTEYANNVHQIILENKLSSNITFHTQSSHNDMPLYYQAADLFISPSRREGFGLAVAESISCGTPVLATKSGGPEEIVNRKCGILVDTDSHKSLKIGLEAILDNLSGYDPEHMHSYIYKNFSTLSKQKKLQSIYKSIF